MKKTSLLTILMLICVFVAHAQHEVCIHFDLRNISQKDTITLSWGANNKSVTPLITSFAACDTHDAYIPLNEPRVIVVGLKGTTPTLELLLSPGEKVTVSGRIKNVSRCLTDHLKVKDAQYQSVYTNAIKTYQSICDSLDEDVRSQYKDICRTIEKSKAAGNEQAIADIYQTPRGKAYIEQVINNFHQRNEIIEDIVIQHKNSFMGPLLMLRLIGRLSKQNRDLYNQLSDAAKLSYYGREVKDEVYPPSLVGDIAPTVTVRNKDGNEKMLSFTRHGNRYLLLDFWASWCEPCHKEIPNLLAIYHKYHDKGLDIIGISADHNVSDWKSTIEEQQEPWCNYIDQTRQAITEYKVQYIPSIFIIDAEGNIIAEKLRGKELSEYVDRLFAE